MKEALPDGTSSEPFRHLPQTKPSGSAVDLAWSTRRRSALGRRDLPWQPHHVGPRFTGSTDRLCSALTDQCAAAPAALTHPFVGDWSAWLEAKYIACSVPVGFNAGSPAGHRGRTVHVPTALCSPSAMTQMAHTSLGAEITSRLASVAVTLCVLVG